MNHTIEDQVIKCREVYKHLLPLMPQIMGCTSPVSQSLYRSYFDEFLKFISIKAAYGNKRGTDFSPGYIVDIIWHGVIAKPDVYNSIQSICYSICHKHVYHHPEREKDNPKLIEQRYLLSQYTMTKVFGPTWIIGTFDNFCKQHGQSLLRSLNHQPSLGC